MNSAIINSLITAAGLAFLWAMFWVFVSYKLDETRQRLYALRDELFDYALLSHTSLHFDHRAYGMLRSMIHGTIRYTHRLTLLNLVLQNRYARPPKKNTDQPFDDLWRTAVAELDPIDQQRMMAFRAKLAWITVIHSATVSPIMLAIAACIYVKLIIQSLFSQGCGALVNPHDEANKFTGRMHIDEDSYHLGGGGLAT